jgi:hypothetical protein
MVIMKNTINAGQAAQLLGITVKTPQRWELVHCFSRRLDRLCNDRRQLQAALDKDSHAAGTPDQD